MSSGDLGKLEKVQAQCIRHVIGAKAHSSTVAIEVITGIVPVRIRIRELCCKEFLRIKVKDQNHILRQLLQDTFRIRLRFCPLEYLRIMSKQLKRALDGCVLEREFSGSSRVARFLAAKYGRLLYIRDVRQGQYLRLL